PVSASDSSKLHRRVAGHRVGIAPSSSKTNHPTNCSNMRRSPGTSARKLSLGPANREGGSCSSLEGSPPAPGLRPFGYSLRLTKRGLGPQPDNKVHLLLHDNNRESGL